MIKKPKNPHDWWGKTTKRRVFHNYPTDASPLLGLLNEFDKVFKQLKALEKRVLKLYKKVKRARKAAK